MRKSNLVLLVVFCLSGGISVFAQTASANLTLISSEKKTMTQEEVAKLGKQQTKHTHSNEIMNIKEKEISLVFRTGPEDDMLSYRVHGSRNPSLVVPVGATIKILFVNTDVDMRHDLRFVPGNPKFEIAVDTTNTVGTEKRDPQDDGKFFAEEIVLKADAAGEYTYFCSVRGHAKGGMWGKLFVGVKPKPVKQAPGKKHGHKKTAENQSDEPEESEMAGNDEPDNSDSAMAMSSSVNLNDPMSRESSGTAWVPDSTPTYGYMKMRGEQMFMLHGTQFVRYTKVGSSRDVSASGKGDRDRIDAPSMFMGMYSRPVGQKGQLGLRAMVSLDPLIERGYGYPLLYQSGESFRGEPLHDRQHPHDFITELSASYSYSFDDKKSAYVYFGYPGEPALGPPVFMHRASAADNPDAPIGHHWQDATHISWGVLTGGISFGKVKFEASAFNGREPDENRWNFEKPRFNSFSGRISVNPTENWALQFSHGYLRNPEPLEPEIEVVRRTTASAIYNKRFNNDSNFATAFIWGQNAEGGDATNSFLGEGSFQFQKNSIFGRIERVQKTGHELVLDHDLEDEKFWVGAYSIGYLRDLVKNKGVDVGIGAMTTFNTNPATLNSYYGGTKHGGFQVFMRFRPSLMKGH